jgi:uncharacterized protein YuzE
MTVSVGAYEFDDVRYDIECDVLDLRTDAPGPAADTFETPEGHLVFLDEDRDVTAIALIGPKELMDRDGRVPVTLPSLVEVDTDELAQALV